MMQNRWVLPGGLAAAILIGVAVVHVIEASAGSAEMLPLASPTVYNENYAPAEQSGTVRAVKRSSSRLVVGVHLGRASGRFKVDDLAAAVPTQAPARTYCVKLTTRDARYWSLNGYLHPTTNTVLWRLETRSKFAADLAQRYEAQDIAIRIYAAADCYDDADGPLIAAIPPGAVDQNVLVLYLNAVGNRTAVRLLDREGKSIASASCVVASRDNLVSYTEICELPLAGVNRAQAAKLQFTLIGAGAAKTPITADIELPEH
jgi:hypothetical protein